MRTTRTCVVIAVAIDVVIAANAPRARADDRLDEPNLDLPTPRVIREDTPGPLYYRVPSDIVEPMMRDGIGMAMRPTTMDHPGGVAFTFDVLAGASLSFGRGASYGVLIEAGYAYSRFHDHLAILGFGPSWRGDGTDPFTTVGVAIVPHVIAGTIDGHDALGVRTSLVGRGWLPFELSHQMVFVDGQTVHEVQLMLSFFAQGGGS